MSEPGGPDGPDCLYDVDGHVATLTLNRPHRRNAISFQMLGLLTEHLTAAERDRGVRCVIVTGAGKGFCSGLDLQDAAAGTGKLMYTAGSEPFMLFIKIGFLVGIFIASPLILWQVWKFIAPGLYSHEKKFAIPFVLLSTIFFVAGGLFAHYIAFPVTWNFFIGFGTDYMIFMPKIDEAFSLYTKMLLGFGLIFEMPTLVFFLARMGVVTGGFLLKYFKYAFLGIFIVAAVISPGTDMVSQLTMAVPMLGLYVISIGIAFVFQKRRKPAAD